jgi:uncharacterized protein (DUF342 family)
MKKLALLATIVFFISGCDTPQSKNKEAIQHLQQEVNTLKDLSTKIDDLQTKLTNLENKKAPQTTPAKVDLSKVNSKIANLQMQINDLKNKKQKSYFDYIIIHPVTLLTTQKVNLYSTPKNNSKIIKTWDANTTFTSYKEKNGFVKVTGYFIHDKWTENRENWWIKKQNTIIKILGK